MNLSTFAARDVTALRFALFAVCLTLHGSVLMAQTPPPTLVPPNRSGSILGGVAQQRSAGRPGSAVNSGDYYLAAGGQKIDLLRVPDEVAVRHSKKGNPAAQAQAFQQATDSAGLTRSHTFTNGKRGQGEILRSRQSGAPVNHKALAASGAVDFAYPVLLDPASGKRMILTDEVLAQLADALTPADLAAELAAAGLVLVEKTSAKRLNVYLLRLSDPKAGDALAASRALAASPKVRWAEPNFVRELEKHFTPSDPLFSAQVTHHNTGQNGAVADADVDAPEAWNLTTGSSAIIIAIIDDGVDTAHPDLSIFVNPGESGGGKETNGLDDDNNGKIDDVRGWDFADNDNNVNPVGSNGHGTGCAGVAAAIGNNSTRTAGMASASKILPVKIAGDDGIFTTDQNIGDAISYAADFADVLSNSYGGGSVSAYIDAAITDAAVNGRSGKGCPVFFASGNSASTWHQGGGRWRLSTAGLSGTLRFGFFYQRGASSGGENAVRVDNVCVIDSDGYTHRTDLLARQDFEAATFPPTGWQVLHGGGAVVDWSRSSVNALGGTGGTFSARSPSLTSGQYAWLFTPAVTITGAETIAFSMSTDMPANSLVYVDVYSADYTTYHGSYGPLNSVPTVVTDTGYPASSADAIAVGSATDCDRRSDYSQYGGKLDFVAPSNGGWNDVVTLDPTGSVGWNATDYKTNFGGTSSACPLAAGTAALLLAHTPTLTSTQVRTVMRNTCDKVGGVTYTSGTNTFYGYGRINANAALTSLGVWVDFTFLGTSTGTFDNPYKTLADGVANVASGGLIQMKGPRTTPTPIAIPGTKPLRLEAVGGTVHVGN